MRYWLLAVGFMSMAMTSRTVIGSALMNEEENAQIEKRIFQKINPTNIDVSSLSEEEKKWVYETWLRHILDSLLYRKNSNSEEISHIRGELADFYEDVGQPDLAREQYTQLAALDLKDALSGSENVLGVFNNLINKGLLKDDFFKNIIRTYQEDQDNFASGKYKYLIEENGFNDHVSALVEAYINSHKQTVERKKEKKVPIIPLYEDVLAEILQKRIKEKQLAK